MPLEQGINTDKHADSPSAIISIESPPINNTRLRRFLVLGAIKLLKRYRPHYGSLCMLSDRFCVKSGTLTNLSEANTLRFIAQHTSIPVPKVYCAFKRRGRTYILMARIDGECIGQSWQRRSAESKTNILSQLRSFILEMRALPPPGMGVQNVDGGSLFDGRLSSACLDSDLRFGPFRSVQDFHRHLRSGFDKQNPKFPPELNKLITLHEHGNWPLPVFTHGDLSSLNILAKGDDIVGIIDWETSGWLPSYWEYTTAYQVNPQNSFWVDEIDKFLDPLPEELAMEKIRQKYFNAF